MNRLNKLEVFYHERLVGTIALYQNRLAAFEYDSNWLANGFSISPFSLPLEKKVFIPKIDPFEGLFGVFADSLPDGWGRLRHHVSEGICQTQEGTIGEDQDLE